MKIVSKYPYPGEMNQECVFDLPASAEIIGMLVALRESPLVVPQAHQTSMEFAMMLRVLEDPSETKVPRRFALVEGGHAVPDNGVHIDDVCLPLPNGQMLEIDLFEMPQEQSQFVLAAEEVLSRYGKTEN